MNNVAVMRWALEPFRQRCHKIRSSTDQKNFHHWKLWNSASRFPSLKVMETLKDIHHWKLWMEIAKVSSQLELNFRSQAHKTAVQSQKLIKKRWRQKNHHFKHRSKNIDVTFYSRYGTGEWGGTQYQVQNLISWTFKKKCCAETVGEEQGIEIETPHCWRRDGQYQVQNLIPWFSKKFLRGDGRRRARNWDWNTALLEAQTASVKFKILYLDFP